MRGINVGGNNIIRMTDLKACFVEMGFENVQTYIQSGNVIFDSTETDTTRLTETIETALRSAFNYQARVVVVTHAQLRRTVEAAPVGFGTTPDLYRYDVLFIKPPLTPPKAMEGITLRPDVDTAHAGENVIYFSRLISQAGQSYLNKIITMPIYQHMTIRNWNTTSKLLALMG